MSSAPMDANRHLSGRRRYLISGYTTSNEDDDGEWFLLEIRLNGRGFHIEVALSEFRNPPSQTRRFRECLACLRADGEDDEECVDEKGGNTTTCTVSDCFSWAVEPYFELFENLAPPPDPNSTLTLENFFHSESFTCHLSSVDDRLEPGPVEACEKEWEGTPPPGSEGAPKLISWTTTFPSFSKDQIRVVSKNEALPSSILDTTPTNVTVNGRIFYFKAIQPPGDSVGKREVEVYEHISRAGFGSEVRTSRLYGVVVDETQQLMGLLLYPIALDDTLEYAVGPDTPQSSRKRWAEQIQATVGALHETGIVWGDAKAGNVVIDVHGDAWVIDFGGGHTRGWVDKANSETIEGDLEGLKNILDFISNGSIRDSQ